MNSSSATTLSHLAATALSLAGRYGIAAEAFYSRQYEGGRYFCHYQLPGDDAPTCTPGAHSIEDAIENLKDALWQADHDGLLARAASLAA